MKICFGTFANVLLLCGVDKIEKKKFVNTIAWSVDPSCNYTSNAINRLLAYASNLSDGRRNGLGNVISGAQNAEPGKVAEYFENRVIAQFLAEENRKLAVLAIRDLITKDTSIGGGDIVEKVSGTTKNALQMQSKFVLSNFLAGVFLFVTQLNNKIGAEYANVVNGDYVKSFMEFKDTISLVMPQNGSEIGNTASEVFIPYLERVKQRYETVKNLLYKDEPKPLYDFYVPNHAIHSIGNHKKSTRIENVTAESLMELSNFLIVEGVGGLGKTTMMQHLLVDAVDNFLKLRRIPVFLALKNYKESNKSLCDYVFHAAQDFCPAITQEDFITTLNDGLFLLLFDGLDEIDYCHHERFEREIERLSDRYPKNRYVISSRPFQSFASFVRYSKVKIQPFTKAQALALVDKLVYRPDEPEVKEKFRDMLDKTLYDTHMSFVQNPLMLTIMLMTFGKYAEVPTKMHIFFRNAFHTMYDTHDATKGAFKRKFKTGLKIDDAERLIAEICFRSYRDGKYEFTADEFIGYFDKLSKVDASVKARDFLYDIQHNLCLIYVEGHYYQFIHRSFQEYFAVLFMSRQTDEWISKLGNFFDKRRPMGFGTKALPMLYDIIPEKVEQFIFVPYLSELFNRCSGEDEYLDFLEEIYPIIIYGSGGLYLYEANLPRSYIYEVLLHFINTDALIISERPAKNYIVPDNLPFYRDFVDEEVLDVGDVEIIDDDSGTMLIVGDEKPEIIGYVLDFKIEDIRERSDEYKELLDKLKRDDFVFKREFTEMHKYLNILTNRVRERSDDLHDLL